MAKIRVRARTVDMLGRQQIASIPTAIHELFKNAHDAYAEHVEVDYYRHDDAFILSKSDCRSPQVINFIRYYEFY